MTDPIQYPCGCVNQIHAPSGVLRSVEKCDKHRARQRRPETLERGYYEELGLLKGETPHVGQLVEALGPIPPAPDSDSLALEVGCGASPYVELLRDAGYCYLGIEPSEWAADWTRDRYGVAVRNATLEDSFLSLPLHRVILAAHVLEHLEDAPAAIVGLAAMLKPLGELWVVVPDDSDPINVDHLWFFTTSTLRSCLESAGLVVEQMAVRKYVKYENFIYCRARKP
jgi:2-polyprenyl-3-methyl-5-hydroxy-6-metoxy-1,4-benzoquinol methylase